MKLEIESIEARLRAPFVSSRGSVNVRPLILVRLEADDGAYGYGEAAPLGTYSGVRAQDVLSALEDCRGVLADTGAATREQVLEACAAVAALPQAVSAIDLALWDLAGRRAGQPVWRLLGAGAAAPVSVNATIAAPDRAGAASAAAAARDAGFKCVKVKVALGDDAGRLAAVRATVGPETAIRLDANGAWSLPEASAALEALAPIGIELCEEPVSGVEQIAELAPSVSVPLALDESVREPAALRERVCEAVCLKVSGCGGITGLLAAAARGRAVGYSVYLASTLDGPLGIAAALHAAAVIAPDWPCGLATLAMFDRSPEQLVPRDGILEIPGGPGLGSRLASWYERR